MSHFLSQTVETARLRTHYLVANPQGEVPVLFIHGNVSSSRFFDETLVWLPSRYKGLAPDLRGFGDSETRPLDATRGMRDFSDDLYSFIQAVGIKDKVHLVGWSAGGCVAMQFAMDHPADVASLVLIAPGSPFGFGGTKDLQGTPTYPDYASSGGGMANPDFVKRLADGDTSEESPNSPRNVMNNYYFKPPFRVEPERENAYVDALNKTQVTPGNYPGDLTTSPNWPTLAPGTAGINNALSPKYMNLSGFAGIHPQPPVLWVRGAEDLIVSDTSLFDFGFLGQLGAVPGWPGAEVHPPQPMVSQVRIVLDAYAKNGGGYREEVMPETGHSPHIERPEAFRSLLSAFLGAQG